jgi:catechol 2,3-dioxygenase-like lactoylglutathione lyase family enzyme
VTDQLGTHPIAQIAIVVDDIETKARAWAEVFGLPLPEVRVTDPVETAKTEYRARPTSARAKLAFFRFANISVELIEPIGGPSSWRDQLETHGDSLHHIAFHIDGMTDVVSSLSGQGIRLLQRGEYTGGRYAYLDAVDQLGLILELLENDPQ